MPSSLVRVKRPSSSEAPSSIEYSVWTCRCTKLSGATADMEETSAPFGVADGAMPGGLAGLLTARHVVPVKRSERGKSSQPTSVCTPPPTRHSPPFRLPAVAPSQPVEGVPVAVAPGHRDAVEGGHEAARGDLSVAGDVGQDAASLVADPPAAAVGDQAGHQLVEPAPV